jgi:hypothetical protein
LTRDEWAARISKTWHGGTTTMVDAIIAVARELDQAKDELGYGEYLLMFEKERVPFGYKKGNMFLGSQKVLRSLWHSALASWEAKSCDELFSTCEFRPSIRPPPTRSASCARLRAAWAVGENSGPGKDRCGELDTQTRN